MDVGDTELSPDILHKPRRTRRKSLNHPAIRAHQ